MLYKTTIVILQAVNISTLTAMQAIKHIKLVDTVHRQKCGTVKGRVTASLPRVLPAHIYVLRSTDTYPHGPTNPQPSLTPGQMCGK